jgi:CheY-like chemotaxis protein
MDILIVDDNAVFRKYARTILERNGLNRIYDVGSAAEGLLQLIKDPPKILILDINMPYVSGMEILDAVKANRWLNDMNIIIVTADEFLESSTSVRRGAIDYFIKPIVDQTKFITLIKRHLYGESLRT